MGLLVPLEHPVRVDPRRAARVFAALGLPRVHVERVHPRDRAGREAIFAVWPPGSGSSVHFQDGIVTLDELDPVAVSDAGYVNVRYGDACARIWRDHAWIEIQSLPPGGIDEAVRILEETMRLVVPPVAGEHVIGESVVDILGRTGLAIYVRTLDRAAAYALFRRVAGTTVGYSWVSAPGVEALKHLPALVEATGGERRFELVVDAEVAADLTERIECEQWQCDHLIYTPETGLLWTYVVHPLTPPEVDAWMATMNDALARSA